MSNIDALLNAAGMESSDEEEQVEMSDSVCSRNNKSSMQESAGINGEASILHKFGNDAPASQESHQADSTKEMVTFEKRKEPKLQRVGIEYTKPSGTSTLLKAFKEHKEVFEDNVEITNGISNEYNCIVRQAQAQKKVLKKATAKVSKALSKAPTFQHKAKSAKSESATSVSACKTKSHTW